MVRGTCTRSVHVCRSTAPVTQVQEGVILACELVCAQALCSWPEGGEPVLKAQIKEERPVMSELKPLISAPQTV